MFITFEGVDGSGKSLQSKRCTEFLTKLGHEVVQTREPGGTKGAEELRNLVLNGSVDRWSPMTELLIFSAARRDHIERVIMPALARNAIVICDRFVDSTRLYQGLESPEMMEAVNTIHKAAIGIDADLTLIFDIEPKRAFERMQGRDGKDMRFEGHGIAFQEKRRQGFLELAKRYPQRIQIIDADQPIDKVTKDSMRIINEVLAR